MPLYTFYPCKPDGTGVTLDMRELPSDLVARQVAHVLLREHKSCREIVAWEGERRAFTLRIGR
jgi:hypothetical protein